MAMTSFFRIRTKITFSGKPELQILLKKKR